jgi:hypothetical protein
MIPGASSVLGVAGLGAIVFWRVAVNKPPTTLRADIDDDVNLDDLLYEAARRVEALAVRRG